MTDAIEDQEMVDHWLLCRDCGRESKKKKVPKVLVDKLKNVGQPMQPALGRCWECQEQERLDLMLGMESEGNA